MASCIFCWSKTPLSAHSESRGSGPVGIRCELGALTSAASQHNRSGSCLLRGEGAKGQKETITTTNNTKINQRTTPKPSLSLSAAGKGPAGGRSLHCPSPSHPQKQSGGAGNQPQRPPRQLQWGKERPGLLAGVGAGLEPGAAGLAAAGLAHREPLDCLPASLCSSPGRGNGAAGRGGGRERVSRFLSSGAGN